jgi:hypothetical protein
MTPHEMEPDTLVIGRADAEQGASIRVGVTGVDVRLDVHRPGHDPVVLLLAPDEAIGLVGLLHRALASES